MSALKKISVTLLFMFMTVCLFCLTKANSINVYAESDPNNNFYCTIEEVEVANPTRGIDIGDFKLSVYIKNNLGMTNIGLQWKFNDNKLIVLKQNPTTPLHDVGPACPAYATCRFKYDEEDPHFGIVSVGAMATEAVESDGLLISFYLRPNSETFLATDSIEDLVAQPYIDMILNTDSNSPGYIPDSGHLSYEFESDVLCTTTVEYTYVLGNINGDVDNNLNGIVDLTDAQRILSMISAYQAVHPGTEFTTSSYVGDVFVYNEQTGQYNGLFVEINGETVISLFVADVNFDNVIDSNDAALILDYYTDKVSGLTPDSLIGTTRTAITYTASFATAN